MVSFDAQNSGDGIKTYLYHVSKLQKKIFVRYYKLDLGKLPLLQYCIKQACLIAVNKFQGH